MASLKHGLKIVQETLRHWAVGGAIIVLTGFAPEEWIARLAHRLHLPDDLHETLSHFDFRIGIVTLGMAIIVWDVVIRHRHRRLAVPEITSPDPATSHEKSAPTKGQSAEKTIPVTQLSIAVLRFANLSSDSEQQYFADGIAEDIITELSRLRWLFVISSNSSFAYGALTPDSKQVSREFGVRYLLEGSVRRQGQHIRVSVQLIDVETDTHIWAERFDYDISNIFAVQDEITNRIVSSLGSKLTTAELGRSRRKHEKNLDAWDLYLRALPHMRAHAKSGYRDAAKLLENAIAMSPEFAAAYARLSACHTQAAYFGWEGPAREVIAKALELARRSQALDPDEPFAYDALASALLFQGEHEGAVNAAKRALELSPTCTAAYGTLISALAFLGRTDEAFEYFKRSERSSPRDPDRSSRLMGLTNAYFAAECYEDAVQTANQFILLRPNWYGVYVILTASLALLGRLPDARAAAERLLKLVPHFKLEAVRKRPMFTRNADVIRLLHGLTDAGIPT